MALIKLTEEQLTKVWTAIRIIRSGTLTRFSSGHLALASAVAFAITGCATTPGTQQSPISSAASWLLDDTVGTGRDFDLTAAKGIEDGKTTKSAVEQLFGKPASTSVSGQLEIWTFSYERVAAGRQKTFGAGTINQKTYRTETTVRYRKALVVSFDANGVVASHKIDESGNREPLQRMAGS